MPVSITGRKDAAGLIPDQEVREIIKVAPQQSVMLSSARFVRMSSKKYKQPVLAVLPDAYWVNGDTSLKGTTKAQWKGVTMTAEELAVIVPIPDAVIDDSSIPLWPEIRPLVAEAIGKKVDEAAIFGVDRPDTWPEAIVPASVAAGNYVTRGTGYDLGVDVADLARKVARQGYGVNGFISKPGIQWELRGLRDDNRQPIYTPLAGSPNSGLYGYPLNEVMNGAWNSNEAELIALDWTKQVIGIRQDITYELFREGVISDEEGRVVLNLMQQDTKALRVVFRVGYAVAKPLTRTQGDVAYPGGVILPESPLSGMTVAAMTGTDTIEGVTVSTLQSSVAVANGAITGTLNYISTGTLATEYGAGHFLALAFTNPDTAATSLKVGLDPSDAGMVALDSDMTALFKIEDKDRQVLKAVSSEGDKTSERTKTFDLSGLTLASAS